MHLRACSLQIKIDPNQTDAAFMQRRSGSKFLLTDRDRQNGNLIRAFGFARDQEWVFGASPARSLALRLPFCTLNFHPSAVPKMTTPYDSRRVRVVDLHPCLQGQRIGGPEASTQSAMARRLSIVPHIIRDHPTTCIAKARHIPLHAVRPPGSHRNMLPKLQIYLLLGDEDTNQINSDAATMVNQRPRDCLCHLSHPRRNQIALARS
jgi:hypothetical protein